MPLEEKEVTVVKVKFLKTKAEKIKKHPPKNFYIFGFALLLLLFYGYDFPLSNRYPTETIIAAATIAIIIRNHGITGGTTAPNITLRCPFVAEDLDAFAAVNSYSFIPPTA